MNWVQAPVDGFRRGDFVRNVHPCNAGRYPVGLVLEAYDDSVYVAIGRGSTVTGPARNWERTTTTPEWLAEPANDDQHSVKVA